MATRNKIKECFAEVPCLTEKSVVFGGLFLLKKYFPGSDKRSIGQHLQKFLKYNEEAFLFLGVTPYIIGIDQNASLAFRTSQYVGSIALRSPETGKQIGDFVVVPRYIGKDRYEDYIQILDLLGGDISPQSMDSPPLVSGGNFRPPMYLEATKFIIALEEMVKRPWRKFDAIRENAKEPKGQVDWNKYIRNEYKIENAIKFPTKRSILTEDHAEYAEIRYVFDLCKQELLSANAPLKIKIQIKNRLEYLNERLSDFLPQKTNLIQVKFSDSPSVKNCKIQANRILAFQYTNSTSWRVDFSDVFEKFIQYIFRSTTKESGGRLLSNFKFGGYSKNNYGWELNHIEPDAILQKEGELYFIEAKYKSHLYNKFGVSELLKDDYRRDLHQLLAYSSFNTAKEKTVFLCYPSTRVEIKETKYFNSINESIIKVKLLGVPLNKESVKEVKRLLIKELSFV